MTSPASSGGQTLPSPSLGPPKLSLSPSPPPFCGMPLDPLPDPEPELEPLDPDAEPDPDALLESLSDLWCLWCLWCTGSVVGDRLLAGSLGVADATGAGLLALGA